MPTLVPQVMPSIYLANYLTGCEELLLAHGAHRRLFKRGEFLNNPGLVNNTSFFVVSGAIHLSLSHDGNEKALNFFGPGAMFPIGVVRHESLAEYEMSIRAFSDAEVLAVPYTTLRRIVEEDGGFAGRLLQENCDFMSYLFFDSVNQAFETCKARVCDILYLYLDKVAPTGDEIPLSQSDLARLAGASQAQTERALRELKEAGAIETARRRILVKSRLGLLCHCTFSLREAFAG